MDVKPTDAIKMIVVDDHQLFRKGVVKLIEELSPRFEIVAEASNGRELMDLLQAEIRPEIVVIDVNMPVMDGFKATVALKTLDDNLKVLALTMLEDDTTLIKLLKAGVNGYLNKDINPEQLKTALIALHEKGCYYTEHVAGKLVGVIRDPQNGGHAIQLNDQELEFIRLSCSEDTYKMIADKMHLSAKTIDGYRARLFEKLAVKSRVGLVIYAIQNRIVSLEGL